jgi:hypothetical protein
MFHPLTIYSIYSEHFKEVYGDDVKTDYVNSNENIIYKIFYNNNVDKEILYEIMPNEWTFLSEVGVIKIKLLKC